ncbi:MAG: hypothetical protein DIU68_019140, partial [Chloroflexota bacterium]
PKRPENRRLTLPTRMGRRASSDLHGQAQLLIARESRHIGRKNPSDNPALPVYARSSNRVVARPRVSG